MIARTAQRRTTIVHAKRLQRLQESEEIAVDRAIHVLGISAGALGSAALVWVALDHQNQNGERWPIIVYSTFESKVLCDLVLLFPDLSCRLLLVIDRLADLLPCSSVNIGSIKLSSGFNGIDISTHDRSRYAVGPGAGIA